MQPQQQPPSICVRGHKSKVPVTVTLYRDLLCVLLLLLLLLLALQPLVITCHARSSYPRTNAANAAASSRMHRALRHWDRSAIYRFRFLLFVSLRDPPLAPTRVFSSSALALYPLYPRLWCPPRPQTKEHSKSRIQHQK